MDEDIEVPLIYEDLDQLTDIDDEHKEINEDIDNLDYNTDNLETLNGMNESIPDNEDISNIDLITTPVLEMYKRLGISTEAITISKEGIGEKVKKGYELILQKIKEIWLKIKNFIIKIWRYFTSAVVVKRRKVAELLKRVKEVYEVTSYVKTNRNLKENKKILLNKNFMVRSSDFIFFSGGVVLSRLLKNAYTLNITNKLIKSNINYLWEILSSVINDSEVITNNQFKNLDLDKFNNTAFLACTIFTKTEDGKYEMQASNRCEDIKSITTMTLEECEELKDMVTKLDPIIKKVVMITDAINMDPTKFFNLNKVKMDVSNKDDKVKYIKNLRNIAHLFTQLTRFSMTLNDIVNHYIEFSVSVMRNAEKVR